MKRTVADLTIRINGQELPPHWRHEVEEVVVQLPEDGISRMAMTLSDARREWDRVAAFGGGASIELQLKLDDRVAVVFSGELTNTRARCLVNGGLVITLEACDKLHRLHRNQRQRLLKDVTDGDVISTLAKDNGLVADCDDPGVQYTSIFQYSCSDFELLQNRAKRLGYVYWVEGSKLHFKGERPAGGDFKMKWEHELVEVRVVRTAGRVIPNVVIQSWNTKKKSAFVGKATAKVKPVQQAFKDRPITFGDYPVSSQSEADALAKGLVETSANGFMVLRARCRGFPMLKPGSNVEIEQLPADYGGTYKVINVTHRYNTEGLISDFDARRENAVQNG